MRKSKKRIERRKSDSNGSKSNAADLPNTLKSNSKKRKKGNKMRQRQNTGN